MLASSRHGRDGGDGDGSEINMCEKVGWYFIRRFSETIGLQLTPVQEVYWQFAQRRMVMTQLEDIIYDGIKYNYEVKELPFDLYKALANGDPGTREFLVNMCERHDIKIRLDNEQALELEELRVRRSPDRQPLAGGGVEEPDGAKEPSASGHPVLDPRTALMKCKECEDYTHDDEEDIEDRGTFWDRATFATKFLWKKWKNKKRGQAHLTSDSNHGDEDTQVKMVSRIAQEETDGALSEDDDNDMFFGKDKIESFQLVDGEQEEEEEVDGGIFTRRGQLFRSPRAKALREKWQYINRYIPFRIVNFQLANLTPDRQEKLNRLWRKAARWPLFTYWLLFVHILIMIVTVSIYGFAPLRYTPFTERALIRLSNLTVLVAEKNITPNIWAGPSQADLVLLGANYAPCMRRDKLMFAALDREREREVDESGCCVRRDTSGCVQVPSKDDCPERFANFVFNDNSSLLDTSLYSNRAVCGTSPRTCESPSPSANRGWESDSIGNWPICVNSETPPSSPDNEHLTCTLTGRPCCVGLLSSCMITTQEHCDFLDGVFHEDAFLCSQVNCLIDICGLVPFARADHPDQITRIVLSLFLHAGIFHLLMTVVFNVYVVRDIEKYLGWLSIAILYIGSGLGGNIISALFVPYSPEVGPSASLFGVIAFFSVYIIYHYRYMKYPKLEVVKYLIFIAIFIIVGLLPYVDNYARFGGFIFGLLLSCVHVHYIPQYDAMVAFKKFKALRYKTPEGKCTKCLKTYNAPWIIKIVLLFVGVVGLIPLFIFSLIWFYVNQETSENLTYFNCVIPTSISDLCLDYRQTI